MILRNPVSTEPGELQTAHPGGHSVLRAGRARGQREACSTACGLGRIPTWRDRPGRLAFPNRHGVHCVPGDLRAREGGPALRVDSGVVEDPGFSYRRHAAWRTFLATPLY